jgi:hypothetical protein
MDRVGGRLQKNLAGLFAKWAAGRGLYGRRAQARPDRAHRRDHAGDRNRAARPRLRKDRPTCQEVAARGGRPILVTNAKGAAAAEGQPLVTLTLPTMPATVAPVVYAVPVQLIAYHTTAIMGTDVDQPRNLAKSVTVE